MSNKYQSIAHKIFKSQNTLYSLAFSIIIYLIQVFNDVIWLHKSWKEGFLGNFMFKFLLLLFSFFLIVIIITTIEELKKILDPNSGDIKRLLDPNNGVIRKRIDDWRQDQYGRLSNMVDKRFEETIRKFANAHKGFIHGMYDNYPHNFTTIFDENSSNYKKLKEGKRSLYIWMNKISVGDYADFALSLLNLTNTSVYSTTYFDNTDFIDALTDDKVINWIDKVNKDKKEKKLNIIRVHMFKNNYTKKGKTIITGKDMNEFISLIKQSENKNALKNYKEKYINENNSEQNDYKVWHDFDDIKFYGEYLIFDEQIMIKYDEDFKTLELYIGKIVEEFSDNFKLENTTHFTSKQKMLKRL